VVVRTEPAAPAEHGAADDDDVVYVPGLAYPRVAAVVVAVAVVVAGLTYALTRPGTPGDPSTVDTGFVVDMRTHHQQAIRMALAEVANGENPVVVGFAREILVRQNVELGLMAAELEDWGIDASERPATAMAWMDVPVPYEEMPGLASAAQVAELEAASGTAADALFLELMAAHHRGGVHMAAYAAEQASTPDVRRLAAGMVAMQSVEIDEYRATAVREGLDVDIEPYVEGEDHASH
jgi:uncharacterized protein (DUF305 family)